MSRQYYVVYPESERFLRATLDGERDSGTLVAPNELERVIVAKWYHDNLASFGHCTINAASKDKRIGIPDSQ
jgi:hypothetical protein